MVMLLLLLDGGKPGPRLRRGPHLTLLAVPTLLGGHDLARPILVRRVVEKGADVVNEQRVKHLNDLFLVGKVESPLERNPEAGVST
jgi:hypothetical protein